MTGYSRERLLNSHARLIRPDELDGTMAEVQSSLDAGAKTERVETMIQPADGDPFPSVTHFAHIRLDDGTPGRVGIIRDVTEEKEHERKLQTTKQQLEVLNRILRHDIQNDVQVIHAWAENLQDELPETYQDELRRIVGASENINDLTQNGRELIRSFTQEEMKTEPVRLDDIVASELDSARLRYPDVDFTVEGSLPVAVVSANETLSSVVRNLLNNAVQHNRDQVTVTVRVEQDDDTVCLLVIDNGPGVPDDQKEQIFGKGERGLQSDGTGIGLYLVNQLVQSYGGDVWVEDSEQQNSPGQTGTNGSDGAVFIIELPTDTG